MNYIDDNKTVQLKGRVACEMGSHELLITELVFNNILTGTKATQFGHGAGGKEPYRPTW